MVFLIQRAQNKDARAVHLKLNELVAAVRGASNRLISVEDLTEDEVRTLKEHFRALAELAKADGLLTESHSVEEARTARREGRLTPGPRDRKQVRSAAAVTAGWKDAGHPRPVSRGLSQGRPRRPSQRA